MSRWFFEDRLIPLTQSELEAHTHHQHEELDEMAETEAAEIQGAHTRAGFPDAPLRPVDTSKSGEIPVRPTSVLATDQNAPQNGGRNVPAASENEPNPMADTDTVPSADLPATAEGDGDGRDKP
jgi:hypothetical protein